MVKISKAIHKGGPELQDRAEFFWCNSELILVVADGAGGRSGGAEAAEFVVKAVKARIHSVELNAQALCHLLTEVDREMATSGKFGETTCVVASLSNDGITGASVGDSGALVFSKSGVQNLTANQVRKPFVGTGGAMPVAFNSSLLEGTLLVASDGLLKYTSQEKIAEMIASVDFDGIAEELVALVRYQSGALPDDVSILLARRA